MLGSGAKVCILNMVAGTKIIHITITFTSNNVISFSEFIREAR